MTVSDIYNDQTVFIQTYRYRVHSIPEISLGKLSIHIKDGSPFIVESRTLSVCLYTYHHPRPIDAKVQ